MSFFKNSSKSYSHFSQVRMSRYGQRGRIRTMSTPIKSARAWPPHWWQKPLRCSSTSFTERRQSNQEQPRMAGDITKKRWLWPSLINRSRKISDIRTDILERHLSAALCYMGNISYRIGAESENEQIRGVIRGDKDSLEAFERFQCHLAANGVNLKQTPAVLGPWLKMNSRKEKFFGKFSKRANRLLTRDYRKPFIVPEKVWL